MEGGRAERWDQKQRGQVLLVLMVHLEKHLSEDVELTLKQVVQERVSRPEKQHLVEAIRKWNLKYWIRLGLNLRDCASSETDMHTYQVFPILELGLWDWETRKTWEGLEMLGRGRRKPRQRWCCGKQVRNLFPEGKCLAYSRAAPEQVRKWTAKWLSEWQCD